VTDHHDENATPHDHAIPVTFELPPAPAPIEAPAEAATEPVATPERQPDGSRPRGFRQAVLAGLAGGLAGALVASGVFVVADDDASSSTSAEREVIVRGANRITTAGDIAAILRADVPAVVANVDDGGPDNGGAAGTGFVISADGVIVTNNHVVEGASKIQAQFSDGKTLTARVLGRDPSSDLAVIKVDGANLKAIELGDSDQVQVGDDVVAIGNALALEGGLSVTRGIISGLHRVVSTNSGGSLADVIQTDAAINPGNSGGPLVDSEGRVIGINTAIADPGEAQNVGFAIPISQAKPIIDQLAQGKQPAYLGVYTTDAGSASAQQLGVTADSGAVVTRISRDSPADHAGIKTGDVIVQLGGVKVTSSADLGNAVRRHKPDEQVDVVVLRDGDRTTLSATLAERPTS
jgi:S1-C subfamily serine protease